MAFYLSLIYLFSVAPIKNKNGKVLAINTGLLVQYPNIATNVSTNIIVILFNVFMAYLDLSLIYS